MKKFKIYLKYFTNLKLYKPFEKRFDPIKSTRKDKKPPN